MSEYIDRDAALIEIERREALMVGDKRVSADAMKSFIKNRPAADVAPVVHGRWEMRPTGMATDTGPEYKAYCTACNEPNKSSIIRHSAPHCGAKMDGGGSDAAD